MSSEVRTRVPKEVRSCHHLLLPLIVWIWGYSLDLDSEPFSHKIFLSMELPRQTVAGKRE